MQDGPIAPTARLSSWVRLTFDDPRRAAFLFAPLLGFLPLPLGSLATAWYFGGAFYVSLLWLTGRIRTVWPPTTAFACLVTLAYFISALISPALFPNRLQGLHDAGTTLQFLVFTLVVGGLVQAPRVDVFDLFLRGLRCGALVAFAVALVQVFTLGKPRAFGLSNSIPFGDLCLVAGGLSLIGFARLTGACRLLALAAAAAGLGACLLSQTRGALLALPVLLPAAAIHLWPLIRRRAGAASLVFAAFIAGAVAIGGLVKVTERLNGLDLALDQRQAMHSADPSTAHRAILWTYGFEAMMERPLGFGSQNAVEEVRRLARRAGFEVPPYNHLHNEFITTAVGRGVIGLAALVLLLIAPVAVAVVSARDGRYGERVAFAAMLTGSYIVFGSTNVLFGHDHMSTFFASAFLILTVATHQSLAERGPFVRPSLSWRRAPDGAPPARDSSRF